MTGAAPPHGLSDSRTSNALDCALSMLSTYAGKPRAAGTISFDPHDPLGALRGEVGGRERAEAFVGRPFEYIGPDASAYAVIAERVQAAGHGAAAIIVNSWPPHLGTGTHAWNVLNHQGRLTWIDPNLGKRGDQPLYPEAYGVWAIVVDVNWNPPA